MVINNHITQVPIAQLRPCAANARTHSPKQIQQIADSIEAFGFVNPVLIGAGNGIVAGHGRVEAAKLLGWERVPVLRITDLTEDQIRAYRIADNRLAELAGWDEEILAIEFQSLQELELDFDLAVTGFVAPEIDILIQSAVPEDDAGDEIPPIEIDKPAITLLGDVWILGDHRIICADARDADTYTQLMGAELAGQIITDPPYNVKIDGNVGGKGAIKHPEFPMASGELSDAEFREFLATVLRLMARFSRDGSLHYVFMDWRHVGDLLAVGAATYGELKNLCVWNKDNGGMGSFYRSKHELIPVFKNGSGAHVNNIELGRHGRNRTNVWDYPGANSMHDGRLEDLRLHPTVKPVALIADAILDASHRGDIILDPFGGSGTAIIAAEQTGRQARLIELDPRYVDVAVWRWQQLSNRPAILEEGGLSFDDIARRRHRETTIEANLVTGAGNV
jgi:DNA modification methylase